MIRNIYFLCVIYTFVIIACKMFPKMNFIVNINITAKSFLYFRFNKTIQLKLNTNCVKIVLVILYNNKENKL